MKRAFLIIVALGIFGCPPKDGDHFRPPGEKPPVISIECDETKWNPSAGSFQLTITYSDEKGLDINSLVVTLNGVDVKASLSIGGEGASGSVTGIPACSGVYVAASIKNIGGLSSSAYCDLDALKIASPQTGTTISQPLPSFIISHDSRTDSATFSVIYDGADISSRCAGSLTSTTCVLGSYITPTGTHGFQAARCFSGGGPCCSVSSRFDFKPPVPKVTIRSPKRFNATLSVPIDLFYDDTSRVLGLSSTTATLDGPSIVPSLGYIVSSTVLGYPESPTSFTATGVSSPLTEGSGHFLTASATDPIYSQTGSASLSFTVDVTSPLISISSPQDGMTSGQGGVPYYIVEDITLPLNIFYSDTLSGIDLASIGVSLTGSGTVSFSAGPSGATGNLLLGIPTTVGSDGSGNFIVQASIKDMAGNQALAGSSITLTLAHLGAGSKTVTSGSYFSIPINVYLDPSWSYGLGSYDIQVSFTSSTISYISVSGSDPANPAYAYEFGLTPSNIGFPYPEIVSSNSQGSGAASPKGLLNIANLRFQALSPGSTTVILTIIYLRDSMGDPIPASRIQNGIVTVY